MSGISLGRVTVRLALGRAAGYALALVNSILIARLLGVEGLGVYGYAVGVVALFALLPNLGLGSVVTRALARDPSDAAGVYPAACRVQWLFAAGTLAVIAVFAAALPGQPVPLAYVVLAGLQLVIGSLSLPDLAVLGAHARYDRLAVAEVSAGVGGTAAIVGAILVAGPSVPGLLGAHALSAVLAVLVARLASRPLLPPPPARPAPLGAVLRETAAFGGVAAVQSLYTRLDVVLLGQMATARAVGLYSAAYKPINMVVYLGATAGGVLFPLLARGPDGHTPVAFERAWRALAAAGPGMALLLGGLAGPLLALLYGEDFRAAAPVVVALAWSAVANWLALPLGIALQARRAERRWLACLLLALAVNAAGNVWAIPRWGAVGAGAATLVSETVLLLAGAAVARGRLGLRLPLRPVLVPLGAAGVGGAALLALGAAHAVTATLAALTLYVAILVASRTVTGSDADLVRGWVRQAFRYE
jgi:O-antigen/teichoic acid export membrane protein